MDMPMVIVATSTGEVVDVVRMDALGPGGDYRAVVARDVIAALQLADQQDRGVATRGLGIRVRLLPMAKELRRRARPREVAR